MRGGTRRVCRLRDARRLRDEPHDRTRKGRYGAADMPDRVPAHEALEGRKAPQVRAFDVHALTRPQVDIAEPRHRAVGGDQVVARSKGADTHAETEPWHAGASVRKAARGIRDGAEQPKFDRHGTWGEVILRKSGAARSLPTWLAISRRDDSFDHLQPLAAKCVEVGGGSAAPRREAST